MFDWKQSSGAGGNRSVGNVYAPLVDTHCHLDLDVFDNDRELVIERATSAGITHIIVPSIDLASADRVIALSEKYPQVYAAVGIHPNDIPMGMTLAAAYDQLLQVANHPRVVAIGEIGLDYHWKTTPPDTQHEWLWMQLELASAANLPVILHNREATADILNLIDRWVSGHLPNDLIDRAGVLHSCSAGWEEARIALDYGFYLGFTGPLTYKNGEEMRDVAERAPADRIVVETDAPFLPPHPNRGKRNEPSFVRLTAEKLSQVRHTDNKQMCAQTTSNAQRLFALPSAQDGALRSDHISGRPAPNA